MDSNQVFSLAQKLQACAPKSERRRARLPEPRVLVLAALLEEAEPIVVELGLSVAPGAIDGVHESWARSDGSIYLATGDTMGLTAAARLTSRCLSQLRPSLVVLAGICGGYAARGVRIGDLSLPKLVFHHQFGALKNGEIHREARVENLEAHQTYSRSARRVRQKLKSIAAPSSASGTGRGRSPTLLSGPMASADLVVKDPAVLDSSAKFDRKVESVDMESYAVAFTAHRDAPDADVLVVKAVSDLADADKAAAEVHRSEVRAIAAKCVAAVVG